MSAQTSEQALSTLEHSTKPALTLLNDAAKIIGLPQGKAQIDTATQPSSTSGIDVARSREQWVLRWLIKRLTPATNIKAESQGLNLDLGWLNQRTWSLLRHLLKTIPRSIARDILVERSFCRTFDACLKLVLRPLDVPDRTTSTSHEASDQESVRPTKKRKLAPAHQLEKVSSSEEQLQDLLDVATEAAHILKTAAGQDGRDLRQIPANWVENTEAAASLIGSLLQAVDLMLKDLDITVGSNGAEKTSAVLGDWLGLWHEYTSIVHSSSKQDPHAAFNSHILVPALTVLRHKSKISDTVTFSAIERQISIHTVLPSRAIFQKHYARSWRTWTKEPAKEEIMPVIEELKKRLGPAAEAFSLNKGETQAALLLNIASRLVPRSDVARRKAEALWLEALFLCLSHLVEPSSSDQVNNVYEDAEPDSPSNIAASAALVDSLHSAAVHPSLPFFRFYVRQAIFSSTLKIPYEVLTKIVDLNPLVFVSGLSGEDSFLEQTGSLVASNPPASADEHSRLVQDFLLPIIEEIGKSRKTQEFVRFWEARLVNTFHDRTNLAAPQPNYAGQKRIWDDPDILEAFTAICQRYATPSVCKDMLTTVMTDLESLPNLVGSTHRTFAQIVICIQSLKAHGPTPVVQQFLIEYGSQLRDAICAALNRPNDYQGQRWLLWKLLDVATTSGAVTSSEEPLDLHQISSSLYHHIPPAKKGSWTLQDRATLMEQLHYFCAICAAYECNVPGGTLLLERVISDLNQTIENYLEAGTFQADEPSSWTGSVDNMNSTGTLLSAVLLRLAAVPVSWLSDYHFSQQLLANVVRLTLYARDCEKHENQRLTYIAHSAEALLATVAVSADVDLVDLYLEAVKGQNDRSLARGLPSFLYAQSAIGTNKDQASKVLEILVHELQQSSKHMTYASVADYLSVLSTILSSHATSLGPENSFASYVSCFELSTHGANLETLTLASSSISRVIQAHVMRSSTTAANEQAEIAKWVKRKLKTVGTHESEGVLDQYDWFAVLSVVQLIPFLKERYKDRKLYELFCKLEKRYREIASATVRRLYKVKSSTNSEAFFMDKRSSFIAWKLIEALICLDEEKDELASGTIEFLDELLRLGDLAGDVYVNVLNRLEKVPRRQDVDFLMEHAVGKLNLDSKPLMCYNSVALQARLAAYKQAHQQISGQKQCLDTVHGARLSIGKQLLPNSVMQTYLFMAGYVKAFASDDIAASSELLSVLGNMASLQYCVEAPNALTLLARLELCKIIFEKQPVMINQNIIDDTLTSISLLGSSANKLTLTNEPGVPRSHHIYDRLCTLVLILLTRYRRRLTDRHHLVIPCLQNLLKCLFYPPTRAHLNTTRDTYPSKASFLDSLPHWLNPPSHTSTTTLPPSSASKFSRVLQTLCDPSTSAARYTAKRRVNASDLNLTDETRHLRQQVSLHTQYLLITYTHATLDGYIKPEVKEKLLPGLYSVLNAMDVEVMRAMNASMDISQREVWKDLYAEWGRFGKWNRR